MPESIRDSIEAARFVRRLVVGDAREHFVTLLLDGRHRAVGFQVVSVGTANACLVHPREVFQAAIAKGACAIILAHNHPSGDPSPSTEDSDMTGKLVKVGKIIGIHVLDSLVVTEHAHTSLQASAPHLWD
jgi:DNA repair protein RadC